MDNMKQENIQRLKDKLNRYESGLKQLKAYLVQQKDEAVRCQEYGKDYYRGRESAFAQIAHDIMLWEANNG